jgi:PRTRC genetic system protein E
MFTELKPLFRKGKNDTILLSISMADDGQFIVGITPKITDLPEEAELINRPISITATPEELDAEFHENLGRTAIKLAGATSSFTAALDELEKAEEELKTKVTATKEKVEAKKKAEPAKPAAKPAAPAKSAAPAAKPAAEAPKIPAAPATPAADAPKPTKLLF